MPWFSRAKVQPYSVPSATMCFPAAATVHSAEEIAPMPEAAATQASPFSSAAILDSRTVVVGLPRRV